MKKMIFYTATKLTRTHFEVLAVLIFFYSHNSRFRFSFLKLLKFHTFFGLFICFVYLISVRLAQRIQHPISNQK